MRRVLIVEDERPMLRALGTSLKKRGYEVDLVETGEAAVSLGTSRSYDVAIVDLGLPGIDGIEVVHALRDSTSIPIIVLSAWHDEAREDPGARRRRRRLRHEAIQCRRARCSNARGDAAHRAR